MVTVPVYFVGDTPQGPRLFREFRRVEADNPLAEAAALMTAGDVSDRDYRTLFPSGTFKSIEYDDSAASFVVEMQDDGLDVLGLVNITTPEEAQTVSGTFTAEGVASSFEATVPWEIRQGDQVVKKGFSTATGWLDKLYPWQTEVDVSDLEAGEYTFVAMTDDPSGGEGAGPTEDTKTIIVR